MDFRDYVAGDDLRHVDWRAFARTDQLKVRLFREEVSPTLDLVVDLSASMGVTPEKERALRDLVEAVAYWAERAGGRPRRLVAGGGTFVDGEKVGWEEGSGRGLVPLEPLRIRSLRVLISDFLFREDPAPQIRRLAAGGAHLYVLHLLDPWELDPAPEGSVTLEDCEDGSRRDLVLDRAAVDRYRERLARLNDDVARAVRAVGGTYARVPAGAPARMFREHLLPQRVLEPA
jgi:uncharacterized protein (DUF58 family)